MLPSLAIQTTTRRLARRRPASSRGGLFITIAAALVLGMIAACGGPARAAGKAGPAPAVRDAAAPLPIGEINTYKALPDFADPYRRGWTLALEQINAQGGVLGRKLVVRSRDDKGDADAAVQAAQALVERDGVVALFGGYSSEVALALSRYADSARVLYLAVAPLSQRLTWQEGNRHTFRLRPAAWMQAAAVAPKALGRRKLRWALVYQDTESDRATADAFKGLMRTFQSRTEFVAEQGVAPGKFDAAATVAALEKARPDAIFNMLTGRQLADLVRAGTAAGLFDDKAVVSLFTGDPENLAVLDAPVPDDWIITGYPRDAIDTAENQAFVHAYRERYGEPPGTAAVLGYAALTSIAEGLKRAGVADRDALTAAFPRLQVPTPFGTIEYRNLDHQSTLGTYLGYTGHADGQLVMDRFVYTSGTRLQPPDEQIRRLRVLASRAAGDDAPDGRDAPPPAATPMKPTRPPMGPAMPIKPPDSALTTRLRGARPGTAGATPSPGIPPSAAIPAPAAHGADTAADSADGAHAPSTGTPIQADRPAGMATPAMPEWPDRVSQPQAAPAP